MAENRIKEIGVRKVLATSVASITTLLCKDFLKLVGLAFLIAVPVAWWVMNQWLQGYPYRVSISWLVFLLAGIIAFSVALLSICNQSINAAVKNPLK